MFYRNSSVPDVRQLSAPGELPLVLDASPSRFRAGLTMVVSAFFGIVGGQGVLYQAGDNPTEDLLVTLGSGVFLLFAVIGFFQGLRKWRTSERATIDKGSVTYQRRTMRGSSTWTEPLNNYTGVSWREAVVHRRTHQGQTRSNHGPTVWQILELSHEDPEKIVPLYVTNQITAPEPNEGLDMLKEALSAKASESGGTSWLAGKIGGFQEGVRPKWEGYAKLLDMPAIDATGGEIVVREAEDLDKTVKELAAEGKIDVEWDGEAPPSDELEVSYINDADTGEGSEILVTIHAHSIPLLVTGGLMVLGGGALLLMLFSWHIMLLLFGVVFGGLGYILRKRSGERKRTIRITRDAIELNLPKEIGDGESHTIRHADIEGVRISKRHKEGAFGRGRVAIVTDRGEREIGEGLSPQGLEWLRKLIQSAIANA